MLVAAEQYGTKAWYHSCDIVNETDVRGVFKTALSAARFPLRGLVTCAGISGVGPAVDTAIDSVKRIMDVNYIGTFICAQEAGREFQKQGVAGSIVLVASMSAHGSNKVG